MDTELVESIGTLFTTVMALVVLVLGFTMGRKFLRKALGDSPSSTSSSGGDTYANHTPMTGYVLSPGGRAEPAEKSYKRYLWNEENNVGGYVKGTGKRVR